MLSSMPKTYYNITTHSYIDRDFLRQACKEHIDLPSTFYSKSDFYMKIRCCQWLQDRVFKVQVCIGNSHATCA